MSGEHTHAAHLHAQEALRHARLARQGGEVPADAARIAEAALADACNILARYEEE